MLTKILYNAILIQNTIVIFHDFHIKTYLLKLESPVGTHKLTGCADKTRQININVYIYIIKTFNIITDYRVFLIFH